MGIDHMETTITTITISLVAILFIIYCIIEFIISCMFAGIIISDDERAYYYEQNIIKGHCKYIYDSLMVEDKFSFPLASKNINKYTVFGKNTLYHFMDWDYCSPLYRWKYFGYHYPNFDICSTQTLL